MIKILNIVQGLVSLFLVAVVAITGGPIWIAILGLIIPITISVIIFGMEEKSPKGRMREFIEIIFGFIFGVGGLLFWAFSSKGLSLSLETSTPLWLALTTVPSVLFNLGIIVAWICWLVGAFLGYIQEFLEYVSGQTVRAR